MFPKLSLALVVAFSTVACEPLSPSNRRPKDVSSVSVAFDPTVLGDRAEAMKTLQVRIFKVQNDLAGPAEGDARRFPITLHQQEYRIDGMSLGLKDIEVAILDAQDLALGTGTVRVLVKPGKNRTEALKIKLTQITQPLADIPVEIKLAGANASAVEKISLHWKNGANVEGDIELETTTALSSAANYATTIKPLLEANCTGCHEEGNAAKKLKLDRFPFVSGYIADAAALNAKVMARIVDVGNPMPPSDDDSLMPEATLATFKEWQTAGFLPEATATGEVLFRGHIKDQKIADLVKCTVSLTGIDGVELMKKELVDFLFEESSSIRETMTVTTESPSVEIPIVVESLR